LAFRALRCGFDARSQTASTITGVVKDTSGAVLPGVTVEAASPEPIEDPTVVTDERGLLSSFTTRCVTFTLVFLHPQA
jgi:hypothetical protein